MKKYYKVWATTNKEDIAEFTPLPNIESARRVAKTCGYRYAIIVDNEDNKVEVVTK